MVAHSPCHPDQFGCSSDKVVKYPYDPAKAKALLKDAGFPDGLEVELYAYRDREYTEAVLGDLVGLVTKHLKKGDRIRIGGLGILQVRKRAARMGRNPATGEPIQIKASKKVAFRAAKELKEAV